MSLVTNIIIVLPLSSSVTISKVNEWFSGRGKKVLSILDGRTVGGDKCLEAVVSIGAYNYFSNDDIISLAKVIESLFQDRESYRHDYDFAQPQLLVKTQDEPMFFDRLEQKITGRVEVNRHW